MSKTSEKNQKKIAGSKKDTRSIVDLLKTSVDGLFYISEIDAPFNVLDVSGDMPIISETGTKGEVEEVQFAKFFERLTRKRDWHSEREAARTKKFLDLQKLIEESLIDLKVYRIGRIRIRILIIGRTEEGCYVGLETNAVET